MGLFDCCTIIYGHLREIVTLGTVQYSTRLRLIHMAYTPSFSHCVIGVGYGSQFKHIALHTFGKRKKNRMLNIRFNKNSFENSSPAYCLFQIA